MHIYEYVSLYTDGFDVISCQITGRGYVYPFVCLPDDPAILNFSGGPLHVTVIVHIYSRSEYFMFQLECGNCGISFLLTFCC